MRRKPSAAGGPPECRSNSVGTPASPSTPPAPAPPACPAWLAGVQDPPCVRARAYFRRWLSAVPGRVVELCCHPGRLDTTLIGRDCRSADDPLLHRRVDEMRLLSDPDFAAAVREAGFTPTP